MCVRVRSDLCCCEQRSCYLAVHSVALKRRLRAAEAQRLAAFADIGWIPKLACACRYGFEKPSAIQQKGIVPFAKGLDVIQQAQSGTGKTATFCAGILQNLDYQPGGVPGAGAGAHARAGAADREGHARAGRLPAGAHC